MNNNIDTIDLEDELFEHFRFEVKGQASVDKYLMSLIQNATRNKIQTAATEGNIFCKRCYGKIDYKVKPMMWFA
jgi:23S rRNA pseudouridine1911/1915/1917 synthase